MIYKVVNMCQFYYELAYTSIRFFIVPQLYKNVLTSLTLGAMEYMNGCIILWNGLGPVCVINL